MLLKIVGAIALLTGQAVAQDCNCACKVDDCFKVLAGNNAFPEEATVSACRAFQWTVITVAAETVTTTALVTATATATVEETRWTTITATQSAPLQKRQARSDVPSYATAACPQPSDYASACACLGVTAGGTSYYHIPGTSTVTTTSTVTATEEETVTVDATATATATNVHFRIRAVPELAENGQWGGQYWKTTLETFPEQYQRVTFTDDESQALVFRAGPDNEILQSNGVPFAADTNVASQYREQLYLQEPQQQQSRIPCTFDPSNKRVSCGYTDEGKNYVYLVAWNTSVVFLYRSTDDIPRDSANEATGPLEMEAVPI